MNTTSRRNSMLVAGLAAGLLIIAAFLVLFYLYGGQFTEEDINSEVRRPGDMTATIEPTGTLPPTVTSTATTAPTQTAIVVTATSELPATAAPPTATAPPTALPSVTPPLANESISVYLVALGDNGISGPPTGCGDSLVFATRTIPGQPTLEARIGAALTDLFSIREQFYGDQQFYNALHQSQFSVQSVTVEGSTAIVNLTGEINLGDDCDRTRIEGQIEQTIRQFPDITGAQVFLNGVPLEAALVADTQ